MAGTVFPDPPRCADHTLHSQITIHHRRIHSPKRSDCAWVRREPPNPRMTPDIRPDRHSTPTDGSERPSLPTFGLPCHIPWQGPFSPMRHGTPITHSINKPPFTPAESIHPNSPIARGSAVNRRTNKKRLLYARIAMNVRSFPQRPRTARRDRPCQHSQGNNQPQHPLQIRKSVNPWLNLPISESAK
jgi:hypothetical protein